MVTRERAQSLQDPESLGHDEAVEAGQTRRDEEAGQRQAGLVVLPDRPPVEMGKGKMSDRMEQDRRVEKHGSHGEADVNEGDHKSDQ